MKKEEIVKIQCGWEDECKCSSCLKCRRHVHLNGKRISLAEAIAIEDFGTVDLDAWVEHEEKFQDMYFTTQNKYGRKQRDLSQDIMRKLMKKITWEKRSLWKNLNFLKK